ncbi:uncharacterized protein LOC122955763 [Acropora millepora]|uniref:uncharacterized protein LOC122955763 n=1 Tax=Acropora millepora TaxID=45264 RepID=UPI001CF4BB24|nr:uncharacterized protein LOC122955763 [Acropora millepora]
MYGKFGCPFSFESTENKAMAKRVFGEVQSVYGMEKWKKAVIIDTVHQYWKSLRDDFTMKSSKKYEEHRRNVKQNNPAEKKTYQAPLKPREDAIVQERQGEGTRNPPCVKCN